MNSTDKRETYNTLDYPHWKRVGHIDFNKYENLQRKGRTRLEGLKEWQDLGAKIYKISHEDKDLNDILYIPYAELLDEFDELAFGTHKKLILQSETQFDQGTLIVVPEKLIIDEPLVIYYDLQGSTIDQTIIKMGRGSKASIALVYREVDGEYHNGLVKIYAEDDSTLNLSEIQLASHERVHIQNRVSIIKNRAKVNLTTIDFGGAIVVTDYSAHLIGQESESHVNSAYLGEQERKLDIGYNTYHKGVRSESLVECKGALMDQSRKVFRGNLRFAQGARKSKGRESEYVLLLDERVQSDAIPALLCDEDDVSGEHAASAGQVNLQQLFYLMSRGFSLMEAKKLIIHGSFSQVINLLPKKELIDEVEEELERRLIHAK
jgi:Fe-S cluster assembly protein SufD